MDESSTYGDYSNGTIDFLVRNFLNRHEFISEVLDLLNISEDRIVKFTLTIIRKIKEYAEYLTTISNSKIKAKFKMLYKTVVCLTITLMKSIAPRAPPFKKFHEKAEIMYLYLAIKFGNRIINTLIFILSNELYNEGRKIFEIIVGF